MDRTNEVLDEPTVRDMLSAFDGQPDSRGRGLGMAICRDWLSLTAKLEQAEQENNRLKSGCAALVDALNNAAARHISDRYTEERGKGMLDAAFDLKALLEAK